MQLFIAPLLSFIARIFGAGLADSLLRFAAIKILIYTLMVTIFPIVIKNLLCWLVSSLQEIVSSFVPGGISSVTISLVGLAGWLGDQLLFSTAFTILISAMVIRFTLNFIPFIR